MDNQVSARTRLRSSLVFLGIVGVILGAGCKTHSGEESVGGEPAINWDNPIDGHPIDLAMAASQLSFQPVQPAGLGEATTVLISQSDIPVDGRAIAFLFDTSEYGRVSVVERLPDVPAEEYDETNRSLVNSYSGAGLASIEPLQNGTDALVLSAKDKSDGVVYWLQGSLEFWIGGTDITAEDAIAIANTIVAGLG
jgi:hypothetical protein